jgi:hypothetical protein
MKIPDVLQLSSLIKSELYREFLPVVEQKSNAEISSLRKGIQDLKGLLANSIQQIADRFHQETIQINDMRTRLSEVSHRQSTATGNSIRGVSAEEVRTFVESQVDVVRNIMVVMGRKINQLVSETNQDAVKFNSFGFRRAEEAHALVERHLPNHKFGLIVDAHMVFERLASSSAKTIPTLQLLVKIEMKDMSQGVAVSSFDQQLPKLLSDAPSYSVIKPDES